MTRIIAPSAHNPLRIVPLAVIIVAAACSRSAAPPQMPPPAVNVAAGVQKQVTQWDEFSGRIEAIDRVEIRPRVSGYLRTVGFEQGKEVRKGDVLFEIDDREYRAALARAVADVERANARIGLAQRQFDRTRRLLESNAVSRDDYEIREGELKQAEADLKATQAAVNQSKLNVEFTRIVSPIDGRVSKALVTPGNLVTSNAPEATLLTTVVSIDPVYVEFVGDEQTYLRYQTLSRTGERESSRDARNPVRMGLANEEGYPHSGHMVFVDNELDPGTGTIRARAIFDNKDHSLTPGLFARLQLLGSGTFAATLIHDRAVLTDQDRKFVYVLGPDNKALRRDVKLGPSIDGLRVVNDGLQNGDKVIVNGVQKVFFPGMPVAPNEVPMDKPDLAPPQPAQPPVQAAAKT